MPVNALLVRWQGGWTEVTKSASISTYGRREAFLSLGALQTEVEAERVADRQLGQYDDPRTEIVADLEPISDADTPYLGFQVGDIITVPDEDGTPTAERVRAITVARDENGELTFTPELKDRVLMAREREEQALKKMSNGTMRGQSPVATPLHQSGQSTAWNPPTLPAGGG